MQNLLNQNFLGEISFPGGNIDSNLEEKHNYVHTFIGGLMGQVTLFSLHFYRWEIKTDTFITRPVWSQASLTPHPCQINGQDCQEVTLFVSSSIHCSQVNAVHTHRRAYAQTYTYINYYLLTGRKTSLIRYAPLTHPTLDQDYFVYKAGTWLIIVLCGDWWWCLVPLSVAGRNCFLRPHILVPPHLCGLRLWMVPEESSGEKNQPNARLASRVRRPRPLALRCHAPWSPTHDRRG